MICRRRPVPDLAAIERAIEAAREPLDEFRRRVASVKRMIHKGLTVGIDPTQCRVSLDALIGQKDAAQRDLALQQQRVSALGERRLDRVIARLLVVDQREDCR